MHAIDGVSLTVNAGECLGIVGESGSGKTMTALSVMRLLPGGGYITGGHIYLDGKDIAALSEDKMDQVRGNLIGMIFQDPLTSLNPTMTIGDQIAESVRLHRGASKAQALARAVEVLGLVGMPKPAERITNYPHQLSGGMRQRVDDRDGAGLRAEAADRRRADDRARRDDPEADPRADRLAAAAARHGGDPGHPRPRRDRRARGPGGGHVRRADRGDHVHRAAVLQPAPSRTPRRCSRRCRRRRRTSRSASSGCTTSPASRRT